MAWNWESIIGGKLENSQIMWIRKLNNTLQKSGQVWSSGQVGQVWNQSGNQNLTWDNQNIWDTAKVVLKAKFRVTNAYVNNNF